MDSRSVLNFISLLFLSIVLIASNTLADGRNVVGPCKTNVCFSISLYKTLAKESSGENIWFSPYSVSTALSMVFSGAKGQTAKEIRKGLEISLSDKELHNYFFQLSKNLESFNNQEGIELFSANSIWPQKGYPFLKSYIALLKTYYQVGIESVDYKNACSDARTKINAWVESKTNNLIKNMIPDGVLTALTKLVLVNAVYFKGKWKSPFSPKHTRKAPFYCSSDNVIQVPFMHSKKHLSYFEGASFKALELPYKGDSLSMLVLLPNKESSLDNLEKELEAELIEEIDAKLKMQKVNTYLPKLKFSASFRLDRALKVLGIKQAFNKSADFSGMDGTTDLYISAVLHKAFLEVEESGTEAAASTAVVMQVQSISRPIPEFRADRPFLLLIREKHGGNILFFGAVRKFSA